LIAENKFRGAETVNNNAARIYLKAMAVYWVIFGLITIFVPSLMNLFQSAEGIAGRTGFSDHVWMHGGFYILSVSVLVFALSQASLSRLMLRAVGLAALMPAIAIGYSLVATPYWNPLFVVAGVGCLAFGVGGFLFANRLS
jgi:hypothetical protein